MNNCKFCGNKAPTNLQGYCQSCYRYFILEGKQAYPLPSFGEVATAENGDVICPECGKAYTKMGQHAYNAHGKTAAEFALQYGLKLRGVGKVRLSNKRYSAHMHDVQDAKTISINLLEKGKDTRFDGANGNAKELPKHVVARRCDGCTLFAGGICKNTGEQAVAIMRCKYVLGKEDKADGSIQEETKNYDLRRNN